MKGAQEKKGKRIIRPSGRRARGGYNGVRLAAGLRYTVYIVVWFKSRNERELKLMVRVFPVWPRSSMSLCGPKLTQNRKQKYQRRNCK